MKSLELHQMEMIEGGGRTASALACLADGLIMVAGTVAFVATAPATAGLSLGLLVLGWGSNIACWATTA